MAIESDEGDMYAKKILSRELKEIKPPVFSLEQFHDTPYAVLAYLDLNVSQR
ncbi:MAG TPA: hypothetical protein VEH06_05220 [Candidatus Bathyarchaeia archaeon]|nr:hypothetical protein [Candidatus Bathyarchaeia archaeon]